MSVGALQPWAVVGPHGETVLQLAAPNSALVKALEPAMREHLAESSIDEWSLQVRGCAAAALAGQSTKSRRINDVNAI